VLLATSYATRTSPVLRGKWVLETLLDAPPPPPPPGVGVLEEGEATAGLPLRERLARHRADPTCASCHDRMDPLGFALEGYDAVGRRRLTENGLVLDTRGTLPDGREIEGAAALAGLVSGERGFLRALARSLLTYALGRGVEASDDALLEDLVEGLADEPTLARLVRDIVRSDAFRLRGAREGDQR
jgi:hypothetical protein